MKYKHILAAIDTTDEAKEVLSAAEQLTKDHGATLSLVTVIKSFRQLYGAIDTPNMANIEEDTINEAHERLNEHAKTLGVSDDRVFVRHGNPAAEIRNLANELDAGVVIIGTHGRHGMGLMFLGSTASGVLHGTHCDVLAVRITEAA